MKPGNVFDAHIENIARNNQCRVLPELGIPIKSVLFLTGMIAARKRWSASLRAWPDHRFGAQPFQAAGLAAYSGTIIAPAGY